MILVDTGPLVALTDKNDQYHRLCSECAHTLREPRATVWPVLTEVMYFTDDIPHAQEAIWDMIMRGALEILPLEASDVPSIRQLMHTYRDLPMDLADAALIRVAEREGTRRFFTVDRKDFSVYRLNGRARPVILP